MFAMTLLQLIVFVLGDLVYNKQINKSKLWALPGKYREVKGRSSDFNYGPCYHRTFQHFQNTEHLWELCHVGFTLRNNTISYNGRAFVPDTLMKYKGITL